MGMNVATDQRAPIPEHLATPTENSVVTVNDAGGHMDTSFGGGLTGRVIFWLAVAFSCFQLFTAAWAFLPSQVIRSVHVGFLLLLVFALAAKSAPNRPLRFYALWALAILSFVLSFYHWVFYSDLIVRAGDPSTADIVVGVIVVALVFEGARRMMGIALPLICATFLAYALLGHLLPYPLNHRGYYFEQVAEQMYLGTEGIYGIPVYVSSTYIFLFILFGAFLERAGMIQLFNDIAMGTVGHARGGPGKVSVISSGLMGTINGSGVANVVTTGQFTIPLMKRFGFSPAFAGGVEATSSMGGQIMPPVMGAVAFIMAETLDVSYATVVTAAVIPAFLYFFTAFWMVHLEAGKRNLLGLPKNECPSALGAIRRNWYLMLPLAALVYLLFSGYTPLFAGLVGLALTVFIVLGLPVSGILNVPALRVVFWILLGFAAAAFFEYGISIIAVTIAVLVGINLFFRGGRETLRVAIDSLADGARNALPVGIACAIVGIIIGVLTLTGAASTFVRVIVAVGEGSIFISLVLTALTSLLLGMGIPTIPNYIITSSIAAPALDALGVQLIVSHMFVFYFGIMADLTPPVALAAFAAAPIARESGLKIGLMACRIGAAGFVVPFMAVYSPALMLQGGDPMAASIGFIPAVIYVVAKALVGIMLWGIAIIGYMRSDVAWWERLWALAAASTLIVALPVTDEIGWAMAVGFFAWHLWRTRDSSRRTVPKPAE
jgi:TRAP transporter 4TM/12TM fusion protein